MLVMAYVLIVGAAIIVVAGIATIVYFCSGDYRSVPLDIPPVIDFSDYNKPAPFYGNVRY